MERQPSRVHWLHVDETNATIGDGPFFIFGGLILTPDQAANIHGDMEEIRQRFHFRDTDSFKFQTAARPPQVSIDDFALAKHKAIQILIHRRVPMVVYVVLHKIAVGTVEENSRKALNVLLSHFNFRYLTPVDGLGMVTVDRLSGSSAFENMQERFSEGVVLPGGRQERLNSIMHVSFSADRMSHLASLVDISLGSFRYCVNTAFGQGKAQIAAEMMSSLGRALWHEDIDGVHQIGGRGYLAYPRDVRSPVFRSEYERLSLRLSEWATSPGQALAIANPPPI